MRFATILLCGASPGLGAGAAELRDNSAYLDFQAMGFFDESDIQRQREPRKTPAPRLLAALDNDDHDSAEVLANLDAVQVRALPLSGEERTASLLRKVDDLSRKLGDAGWDRIVRVREHSQRVEIYLQHDDTTVSGLAVLAVQPDDEPVFVNLVGHSTSSASAKSPGTCTSAGTRT